MAKGAFGNPLSAGIALSGVIDIVTPVRQAEERKRQREAAEKKDQDERAKELGAVMSKIAIDEDKIWWRYHDDARLQYADTIDKVQQMYNAGDYAGMYKTINQFDTKMANYIQATQQKEKWKEQVSKGDKYYDQNYLNALENRDIEMTELAKIADETGFGTHDQTTNILGFMDPVERVDLREKVKKAVDGQKYLYEKNGKKLKVVATGAGGEPVYEMSLQDAEGTIAAVKKSIQPYAVPFMLMEAGYSKEDQLKMSKDELQAAFDKQVRDVFNLYATKEEKGAMPRESDGSGWSGTKSDNWKVTKTDRTVDLGKDDGKLYGYDVFYTGKAQKETTRLIQVSQGSYWAKGGDKFLKVNNQAEGEGMSIPALPAGLYVRKDKPAGEGVWAAYKTPYEPPTLRTSADMPKGGDPDVWEGLGRGEVDWSKTQSWRTIYVPIKTTSEANAFMSAMNMPDDVYNSLIQDVQKQMGTAVGAQSTASSTPSSSTYTVKGKKYSEKDLLNMGYTVDQIAPYKD